VNDKLTAGWIIKAVNDDVWDVVVRFVHVRLGEMQQKYNHRFIGG
jgi:hypothetical protein